MISTAPNVTRMKQIQITSICWIVLLLGCSVFLPVRCAKLGGTKTRQEVKELIQNPRSADWYYVGSDQRNHYLHQCMSGVSVFPLPAWYGRTRFKIKQADFPLAGTMPYTRDEEKWVRFFWKEVPMTEDNPFPWDVSIDYIPEQYRKRLSNDQMQNIGTNAPNSDL